MSKFVKLTPNASTTLSLQWGCFLITVLHSNLIIKKVAGKLITPLARAIHNLRPLSRRSRETRRKSSYPTKKGSHPSRPPVSSTRLSLSKSSLSYRFKFWSLFALVEPFHRRTRFKISITTPDLSRSTRKKEDFMISTCSTRKVNRFSK